MANIETVSHELPRIEYSVKIDLKSTYDQKQMLTIEVDERAVATII